MTNNGFILNFTPTGMIPTKGMTPFVPVTPSEIVEQVLEVKDLGVSMVHLHAREPDGGEPTHKKEIYENIIRRIREKDRGLILCVSTSGRNQSEFEKRSQCLEIDGALKPDCASLTLSSMNFNKQASINTPETIQALARRMLERGIKPELEAFDLGMINYAKYLITKGLLKPPYYFNLILGNIACAQAEMLHLGLMVRELPQGSIWSTGGVGDSQLIMNVMGLISGGGVRVGLEDNIWYDADRTNLATNRKLVERVVSIAQTLGYRPYRPAEVRRLIGLC
jgi:3-keto-5-aminohexanoate cleavage enzyme